MGGSSGSRGAPGGTKPRPRIGLTARIALSVCLLSFAPTLLVAAVALARADHTATVELERRGDAVARLFNYSFEVLLEEGAVHNIQRVVANSSAIVDVRRVTIVDLTGSIIASSDRSEVGTTSRSPLLRRFLDEGGSRPLAPVVDASDLVIVRPLHHSQAGGGAIENIVGAVEITLDRRASAADASADALRTLWVGAIASFVLSAALAAALRRLLVRPLGDLAATARAALDGDRSRRSGIRSDDELGELSRSLDALSDEGDALFAQLEAQIAARLSPPPAIEVHRGVLLFPLSEHIEPRRVALVEVAVVAGLERYLARVVILDLTGVRAVPPDVARAIVQAKRTAELLGAYVIVSGAPTDFVATEVGSSGVPPYPDVDAALRAALRWLNTEIHPRPAGAG